MHTRFASLCLAATIAALPALADFSYQETSRVTGGSITRMMKMVPGGGKAMEPQTSTIYLKGNKLATAGRDSINIVDLDTETITDINLEKKTYSVITFQEMAAALEAAKRKMEEELRKNNRNQPEVSMSFNVKVDETGQTRQISGYNTKEMAMLLQMQAAAAQGPAPSNMEFDIRMWMAPDVRGYDEVRRFYTRMAAKMNWHPRMAGFASLMNMQPGMGQGMAEMMKEMQKLEGVPILQTTAIKGGAMGAMGDMPSLSEAMGGGRDRGPSNLEDAAANEAARQAQWEASRQASRATGGRLGGLAGSAAGGMLGGLRRKKAEPKPEPAPTPAPAAAPAASSGAFMEMTSESSNFSTAAIDPSRFSIPVGLRQVDHEMKKLLK